MSATAKHFQGKNQRGHVKHAILENYLKAWFPINLNIKRSPVYVDGFAGPGKHENGDDGSPLLVLKMLKNHNVKGTGTVDLFFIEKDKKIFEELKRNLESTNSTIPSKNEITIHIHCQHGDFNDEMMRILPEFENRPMLVFADPFGFNCKMSTLQSILQRHSQRASKELLINFMDGNVVRFLGDHRKKNAINELMGCSDWQFEENNGGKLKMLGSVYVNQLKIGYNISPDKDQVDIKTLMFSIKGKNNSHVYHIVYATSHIMGIMAMKRAMNKSSQAYDDFTFSEWLEDKKEFRDFALENELKIDEIVTRIKERFAGQSNVTGREIEFDLLENTKYQSNVKRELKEELKPFLTSSPRIKRFEEMTFKFPKTTASKENNINDSANLSESTNKDDWKISTLRIKKHFAGKTVSGKDISAFFKTNISATLKHEQMLQKKLEPYRVDKKGRIGFTNTMYFFPKLPKKIPASPRGQVMITNYFKSTKYDSVDSVKKDLKF